MSYEILVGLHVVDDVIYDEYRAAMKPILSNYEGYFGYDFKVSDEKIHDIPTYKELIQNNFEFKIPNKILLKYK